MIAPFDTYSLKAIIPAVFHMQPQRAEAGVTLMIFPVILMTNLLAVIILCSQSVCSNEINQKI